LCKQEVQAQGRGAVKRFGKWFCSTPHADLYELNLYEDLRTVHGRHTGCHGAHVPWPEARAMDFSPPTALELANVRETSSAIAVVGSEPSSRG
jgi:hypothetical protein